MGFSTAKRGLAYVNVSEKKDGLHYCLKTMEKNASKSSIFVVSIMAGKNMKYE